MLKTLCLALLASLATAQGFSSQVKEIVQYNEGSKVPFVFGIGPGQFQRGGLVEANGTFTAAHNRISGLVNSSQINIKANSTFVFQFRAGFNATNVPEWGQADPRFGCFSILLSDYMRNSYNWVLTNTQAYAYIANNDRSRKIAGAWSIPLFARDPSSIDLYTVAIDTAKLTVTYLVNDRIVLKLDGDYGIDPRFRYLYSEPTMSPAKMDEKRSYAPIFSATNFPTSFSNFFSMARIFNATNAVNYCVTNEPFDGCRENIAYVPSITCNTTNTRIPETDFPGSLFGVIEKFEMFYVEGIDRCGGQRSSSSSDFRPWWQRAPNKEMIKMEEHMEFFA